jgi:protein-L-isoaspartate(D-aspartate) O-methyltransferase
MLDYAYARETMVARQVARRGIRDARVLDAMREVPREAFVDPGMQEFAYEDAPLPIGSGQTISQPYIVALMAEAAALRPGDSVLEIGAGSGYAAAVVSRLAAKVYAIERHGALAAAARRRLAGLGFDNVYVRTGDGSAGWPEFAPFDAILAAAGGPAIPQALKEQLDIGGRLVMPVGARDEEQRLVKVTRVDATRFEEEDLGAVRFVPLIGQHGWPSPEDDPPAPQESRSFARPL